MTYNTDERLKNYLDTNQLQWERMCLAILSIDKRFTNVRPRHPRGGPDGGRDIEAMFQDEQKAYGAVGFLNQATDSKDDKKKAQSKFRDDLTAALDAEPGLKAFVFFTNVNLTASEKEVLDLEAKAKGVAHCEIMDRERMRIVLDGADGLSIRFQALGIPMSDTEQATFFARWGDDIQGVIAEGFGEIRKTLSRMQFLAEMHSPLERLIVALELDREYEADEIGHFRFFCSLSLAEPKDGLFMVTFGRADRADRCDAQSVADLEKMPAGILHGMMGARWERRIPASTKDSSEESEPKKEENEEDTMKTIGTSRSIGLKNVRFVQAELGYGGGLFRLGPYLRLSDIDGCMLALFLNRTLSEKIKAVHIYGNEYKLGEYPAGAFHVDTGFKKFTPGVLFTPDEQSDEWVRIMSNGGPFRILFSQTTPVRMFEPTEATASND